MKSVGTERVVAIYGTNIQAEEAASCGARAGLYSISVPKNGVVEHETALKTDKFLLMVHGMASEVKKDSALKEGQQQC
jgi:hypothetical protein